MAYADSTADVATRAQQDSDKQRKSVTDGRRKRGRVQWNEWVVGSEGRGRRAGVVTTQWYDGGRGWVTVNEG